MNLWPSRTKINQALKINSAEIVNLLLLSQKLFNISALWEGLVKWLQFHCNPTSNGLVLKRNYQGCNTVFFLFV